MKGYKKKKDYNSMIQRLDDAKKGVGMHGHAFSNYCG